MKLVRGAVFVAGAALMSIEMLASRVLAPVHGDTLVVWSSIIGVMLGALAIGYFLGGWLSDKRTDLLGWVLVLFGGSILLIPFIRVALPHPLLDVLARFLLPGMLAGMVDPIAVKMEAKSLSRVGTTAGSLYGIATLGSVLGVFGTVFFLIRVLAVPNIFLVLGVLLGCMSVPFLRRWYKLLPLLLILLAFLAWHTPPAHSGVDVLQESAYGTVHVFDLDGIRHMVVNKGQMSEVNLSDPLTYPPYWEYLTCMERPFHERTIHEVLQIGLGAGSFARRAHLVFGAKVTSVEINPVVAEMATEYFGFPSGPDNVIVISDGRSYLANSDVQFDMIAMDVMHFNGSYRVPAHLVTQEFFTLAREHLTPEGVLVIHVPRPRSDTFAVSVGDTLRHVFPSVTGQDCGGAQVFIASKKELLYGYEPSEGTLLTDAYVPFE